MTLRFRLLSFALLLTIVPVQPSQAQNQEAARAGTTSTVDRQAAEVSLGSVVIVQDFLADGDAGQCNGGAQGRILSQGASWSPAIRIDTDNRPGGCLYRIGIVDLGGTLRGAGFGLDMNFSGDGDATQCGGQGPHPVPINSSFDSLQLTTPIRMDMDNRAGGCLQVWSVTGTKILFDINFFGDGDVGQCGNIGSHSAPPTITLRVDTDNRPGGCNQSIRLRLATRGFNEATQAASPQNILDSWRSISP